ncbi:DUF1203 domain-containing protein [Kitasatospora sp. NBC_00240]|uniref:DUF1203 domain-containing protein n=1 Tax=Kitasatospora sp. NBC_00240 TaxID=2903567 RepID=UPI002258A3DA|nr:DUF1203 domain-containing protein [Kitasatospora sp. NBC_00240]MCX5211063.1 DUF1203 domain-containing protein [Kitasatospora sp. NBC_00240]
MTTTAAPAPQVRPIDPAALRRLRERDDAGRPPVLSVDEEGGAPLRCCLTRARPGERIALLSYAPLRRWAEETGAEPGPYDEVGPVFVHAQACPGAGSAWPAGFHGSERVLRAYDRRGHILGGTVVTPDTAETAARGLLADPEVALVHVRALEFGCFLHEVRRG